MLIVPSNIGSPASFTVFFYSPPLGFDCTTVTAVQFAMLRRDGTQTTLSATIVSQTQSELVAQYTFVGGEITTTGNYLLAPQLSVSGGFIPAETVAMFVTSPFMGTPKLETRSWFTATAKIPGNLFVPNWEAVPLFGAELISSGSPYSLPVGNSEKAVNLALGQVSVTVLNGGADGEYKRFLSTTLTAPLSENPLTIYVPAGNLYPGTVGDGNPQTMTQLVGQFDATMTWVAAARNGAGAWYL